MQELTQESQHVTVYGRPSCPMVPPVLHALDVAAVPYVYVDIRQSLEGREHVRAINHGNESVPTLVFPDGTTLTEPGLGALRKKLVQSGYADEALQGVGAQAGFILRNPMTVVAILTVVVMLIYVVLSRL